MAKQLQISQETSPYMTRLEAAAKSGDINGFLAIKDSLNWSAEPAAAPDLDAPIGSEIKNS